MGGGKGTATSTTKPPKEIMDAYKQSLGMAEQATQQPYQQYQGQLIAGLNPTQQQGISNVNAAQGAALPYIQQGASYTNQAAQGVNPGMINQFMSPYLNNVVGATQRNLMESNAQQQQAMKSGAIQSGAFGGDRARFGQAELARQQGLAGGQVIGGLLNQGFGQAMAGAQQNVQNMMAGGQQLGAMGQAAQQSILGGAQAQLAAGAQQQATEQAFLQSAYDQYLQRQAYPYQQAQFFANIAQGIGAGAGGTTTQQAPAPNPFSQALGALTAIGTISDERAKENIEPVGETYDGQKIYRYNYKGDNKTNIGLLAQEVEKTHPEAVGNIGDLKMVDLEAATENAAQRSGKASGGSSMGGLVSPSMQREAFAAGGAGFGGVPYADFMQTKSWLPEGALAYRGQSPGSTFPTGFKMEDLEKIAAGSDFDELNAMDEDQIALLKKGLGRIGDAGKSAFAAFGSDNGLPPMVGRGPFGITFASGGVVPRHGYATDGAVQEGVAPEFEAPSPEEVRQYIIDAAKKSGVSPDEALKVYASEGLAGDPRENWQSKIVKNGVREESYGPFQLNMGKTGLGTAMLKNTGVDPRDPKNWRAGVDFGLAEAARGGWKPWMGAAKIGLTGAATPYGEGGNGVVPQVEAAPSYEAGVVPAGIEEATASIAPAGDDEPARKRSIIENILGKDMSEQARTGMLAAGLAMLGGRSPYFGVNVGKGALAGMDTYYKGLANERELAKTKADITSTLATAGKTGAESATVGSTLLGLLQNTYQSQKALATSLNQEFPTWEQFLDAQGYAGRGWEAVPPVDILSRSPAAPSGDVPSGAPQPAEGEETTPEEGGAAPSGEASPDRVDASAPRPFSSSELPSSVVRAPSENINIPNTVPSQNPYLLSLKSDQASLDQLEKLNKQGYVLDTSGNRVYFRSGPQIEAESQAVVEMNKKAQELQEQTPQIKNVLKKISDVLKKAETTKLTSLRGEMSGLLYALNAGGEEELKNASDADLLNKLFKQLSLMSNLGGAEGSAGIEKIRQIEAGSGTATLSAPAAREIVGNALGIANWNEERVKDWGRLVDKNKNAGITEQMRNQWMQMWNEKLPYYVNEGIANTPVKDNSLWGKREDGKFDPSKFKEGWKYVMPEDRQAEFGEVAIYRGNGKFAKVK